MSAAVRTARYNDVDSTTNPKFSHTGTVVDGTAIRSALLTPARPLTPHPPCRLQLRFPGNCSAATTPNYN